MRSHFKKIVDIYSYLYKSKINENAIFVLGNQKSGTTVIAALIAKAGNLSVELDIEALYEPTQTQIHFGKISFNEFVEENKRVFSKNLIKEPSLTFLYNDLIQVFPNSKYLFIIRDPRDNIRSILNRLAIRGDYQALPQHEYNRISKEWRLILNNSWLGLDGNTYIESMAFRWNYAATTYLKNSDNMVLVRYEDFKCDKVGVIKDLVSKLEIDYVNDIDSDIDEQYQTSGNSDVKWDKFFGKNLYRIKEICGKKMKEFGYK